ncbi:MAG TPA: hypothetical protein VFJ58_06845 [Armatimonadota bacterium]|nr:hypothetical protein [Armatimonadota bacterium]
MNGLLEEQRSPAQLIRDYYQEHSARAKPKRDALTEKNVYGNTSRRARAIDHHLDLLDNLECIQDDEMRQLSMTAGRYRKAIASVGAEIVNPGPPNREKPGDRYAQGFLARSFLSLLALPASISVLLIALALFQILIGTHRAGSPPLDAQIRRLAIVAIGIFVSLSIPGVFLWIRRLDTLKIQAQLRSARRSSDKGVDGR